MRLPLCPAAALYTPYLVHAGPTNRDGRLGNFAQFKNCTFHRNKAEEFGAAINAITVLFLQYTGGFVPVEIIDRQVCCDYLYTPLRPSMNQKSPSVQIYGKIEVVCLDGGAGGA